MSKKLACFLFMGFLLVAYGGLSVVGVTAVAAVIAAVLVFNTGLFAPAQAAADVDDNEF